ncbi:hypothetical protein BXP70_21495 [Hymenobacter crusticola]|uniref:Outer membrane protein beta-barrel domain-containing protein n=1 Tax=Hymenobacter crusticola TaxID=1770526 RepID=A0A243W8W1_9BACT|nr:hypothetical protein BXP70_21495 [Hymenobacter crusticola]
MSLSALAQTAAPESQTTVPLASTRKTLIKLGLGVVGRGYAFNGFNDRFYVPLSLELEHQLNERFSVYGGVNGSFRVTSNQDYYTPFVNRVVGLLGGRYYYNQQRRVQEGKAAGPFVGNYLALQASSDFVPYSLPYSYQKSNLRYSYSTLSALWGMQRRLGRFLLYDVNAGLGVSNPSSFNGFDSVNGGPSYKRKPKLRPELNVRFSLVH